VSKLRILVADDHDVVRRGLRAILESHPEWEVVAEAVNGRDAVELAGKLQPDVVVLDIGMPEQNGLEAARRIREKVPTAEVLILTMHESDQVTRDVLSAGARGYVLKSDAARDLVAAVEALSRHKLFFTSKVSEFVLKGYLEAASRGEGEDTPGYLSAREREVLQLLAEGRTTKEVASSLHISVKTAETHRANLMRKLDLHTMSDLVRYAIRNKIVEP
jgi:DNA-binding NarL/FixJ family response regulator